jgi:uncharacterized membrane protein (DUF373 family)
LKGDGLADTIPRMAEQKLGHYFPDYLGKIEAAIYYVLAVLLSATALLTIATAGELLWDGLIHWTLAAQTLRVLNELLIVLMLVEILHTVRISVRSHILITEPFLVVGLIASIRRILVVTLEESTLSREGAWSTGGASSICTFASFRSCPDRGQRGLSRRSQCDVLLGEEECATQASRG